jgi:AhpD family alkylhydroperoxidase
MTSQAAEDYVVEPERMDIDGAAPAVYRAMIAFDNSVELEPRLRELVKLRASVLNHCAYCVDMHAREARALGETEQRLYAVSAWREAPFFTGRERAAFALTDALTLVAKSHVPDDVYEEAARHFDQAELAQLIWAIAAINVWNRIAVSTRMVAGT